MKQLLATLFTLALMVSTAYAHNGMEHVMGTVASVTDNSIAVTTTNGKTQTVMVNADTKFTRMDTVISVKDIKVGDKVVIYATQKDEKLTAATVQIGMGKTKEMHDDMRGMDMNKRISNPAPLSSSAETCRRGLFSSATIPLDRRTSVPANAMT